MGRKGVSKRKPSQKKAKQLASDNSSGVVSSLERAIRNQPIRLLDTDKAVNPTIRSSVKSPSDSKKNNKKR
jgi:hypothetical protein